MKQAPPEENLNTATVVDAEKESWTCTPEGDLEFLSKKKRVDPNAE